jgi:hypothetical protein
MGLKDTIAGLVSSAFDNLGDLIVTGTYVRLTGVAYDPVSRRVSGTENRTDGVRVALARIEVDDTKGDKRPVSERRALIPAGDIPFAPQATDFLELDGITYTVTQIKTDPAKAMHTLTLVAQ